MDRESPRPVEKYRNGDASLMRLACDKLSQVGPQNVLLVPKREGHVFSKCEWISNSSRSLHDSLFISVSFIYFYPLIYSSYDDSCTHKYKLPNFTLQSPNMICGN